MSIKLNVTDETSTLDLVILGIGEDIDGPSSLNPKSKFHLEQDSYPLQIDILNEINSFEKALIENGVKVLRPKNIKNLMQIFTRDVGFVIGDEFYISNLVAARKEEIAGIEYMIELFDKNKVVDTSKIDGIRIEGGDVLLWRNKVFVGLSDRTNDIGYNFLKKRLSGLRDVKQVKIVVDKNDHRNNVLHLDCAFQPIGEDFALVYEEGLVNKNDLYESFDVPSDHIFKINKWQFVRMFTNIFSVSKNTVVIEKEFIELKYWLLERGFNVVEVNYKEISKLSGLLRCSTLPLVRK